MLVAQKFEEEIKGLAKAFSTDLKSELTAQLSSFSKACEKIIDKYDRNFDRPKDTEIYHAAYLCLKGRISEDIEYLYDIVAYGLYLPIEVLDNKVVAKDKAKLEALLNRYSFEAYTGNLLRETWLAVMRAYFHPSERGEEQDMILAFLTESYNRIYNMAAHKPSWLEYLHDNPELLSKNPCARFGDRWFSGDRKYIKDMAKALQIPEKSWFWENMMEYCIHYISNKPDENFEDSLNDIIIMLDDTPSFIDQGLALLLKRYSQCADTKSNDDLKNFSISLWKNPRFRYCGISKWMKVDAVIWRMSMDWVNEDYMRLFFDRISDRHGEDKKSRLAAWLKYVEWSRYVSNLEEGDAVRKDKDLGQLFMMEEEAAYSQDSMRNEKLDTFIERVGKYIETVKLAEQS